MAMTVSNMSSSVLVCAINSGRDFHHLGGDRAEKILRLLISLIHSCRPNSSSLSHNFPICGNLIRKQSLFKRIRSSKHGIVVTLYPYEHREGRLVNISLEVLCCRAAANHRPAISPRPSPWKTASIEGEPNHQQQQQQHIHPSSFSSVYPMMITMYHK